MDEYNVCDKDKGAVRALFNVNEEEVKNRIKELKEWIDTCPEIPQEAKDDHFLDIMLLRAKFRDDYVKKNIKNYFKTLSTYPEIFKNLGKFKPSEEVAVALTPTKTTSKFERINILKLSQKNLNEKSLNLDQLIQVIVSTGLLFFHNDYTASSRFILDFDGITFRDLFKVNIKTLFKLVRITEDMLRVRISGIELYNAPRIITPLLSIARILLKPKMLDRVTVHKDLASLQKNIPAECLPSDYGGDAENTEDLIRKLDKIIDSEQFFFDKISQLASKNSDF